MTASPTQKSYSSTGNIRAWWVPGNADPTSVAVLTASTTKDVTFSLTGSGFTPNTDENKIPDSRMGQRQVLSRRGNFSEDVSVEYVYGDINDIAAAAMTDGSSGSLVVRRAVANEIDPTVGQKVTIYSADLGKQMEQPPTENSIDTIKQNLYLNAPTQNRVALKA